LETPHGPSASQKQQAGIPSFKSSLCLLWSLQFLLLLSWLSVAWVSPRESLRLSRCGRDTSTSSDYHPDLPSALLGGWNSDLELILKEGLMVSKGEVLAASMCKSSEHRAFLATDHLSLFL
jgi:hypothetical protein